MKVRLIRLGCQRRFLSALAAWLAMSLVGEARIVFVQLPPSPSLGLVQNTNGDWIDPFAAYDKQGLRLWGGIENPTNYNLVINGQTAFTFSSGTEFGIIPANSNSVIGQVVDDFGSTYAIPLTNNEEIGNDAADYVWSSGDVLLTASRASDLIGSPILTAGYFSGLESAFIGLQFEVDGQTFYGWVRAGAPVSINGGWIYDYAYETSSGMPIKAGQTNEPISFTANLSGANEIPQRKTSHSGTGTFILDSFIAGYKLSYHLEVDGSFVPTSAGIFGPANPNIISPHQITDLGNAQIVFQPPNLPAGPVPFAGATTALNPPRIILPPPSVLVYDGQVTLSSKQVAELLRGQLYVNLKSLKFPRGELRGEILPAARISFSADLSGRNEIPRHNSAHRGEAAFTLAGASLTYQIALDSFSFASVGIYDSVIPLPNSKNLIAKLDTSIGVIVPGTFPGASMLGFPGQTFYSGSLTLSDEQVCRLRRGEFFIHVLTPRFRFGEIGGRIVPNQ
jgi:CHRD domain